MRAEPSNAQPQAASWETYLAQGVELQDAERFAEGGEAYAYAMRPRNGSGRIALSAPMSSLNLGRLSILQKDYPAARAAFGRSLMTLEKRFGPDH